MKSRPATTVSSAGPGYDEVTGLGSPIANLLVPDLASYGLPTQLVITAQPPATVTAGSGFGLTVTVEDRLGNVVTDYNGSVTIALASNPGGGTLDGNVTAEVVNGVATFSGLTLDVAGDRLYLRSSRSGSLPPRPRTPVTVTPAAAKQLVVSDPTVADGDRRSGIRYSAGDRRRGSVRQPRDRR